MRYSDALEENDIRALIRLAVSRTSLKHWSGRQGFSAQYICDVIKGRREVSANLAAQLGYQRLTVFAPAKSARQTAARQALLLARATDDD